jgi:uncharacterized protein with LGFP repeats
MTDEQTVQDGKGRFSVFQEGAIYWTEETGAHEVHGGIRQRWEFLGGPRGRLGYPVSDEHDCGNHSGPQSYRASQFEGGSITWAKRGGAIQVSYR